MEASPSEGSTFLARRPVRVMAPRTSTAALLETDALFQSFVSGLRGETLRAQLAAKHPERTHEEIEDAIQTACKCFIDETDGITAPGQIYRWIRTVAHRALNRERELLTRQIPFDPSGDALDAIAADSPSPEQLVIGREDEIDLAKLTETVTSTLPDRQRDVLALYGAGYRRPEIAAQLGIRERIVTRDLLEILDKARAALARLAGGGCEAGEALIVRLACGLATPVETSQAQLHLARCQRCQQFHERLNLWREKVGAILPIPASEHIDPGVIERVAHKSLDALGSLRQHIAEGGSQVKQHAATSYYRATDLTPAAGARPGAVAAVVAGCLAAGTGTYTCVEQGINPLTVIPGVGERSPQQQSSANPPEPTTETPPLTQLPVIPDDDATPTPPTPSSDPGPERAQPASSELAPAPASGADSLSGLNGNPTASPAPAPAPPPTSAGSDAGGNSGTTFGGL